MLANGGTTEGLFRGAFMNSGSPIPIGDISHGQGLYDELVAQTGCKGATDTLECLRGVPYDILKRAQDATPSIDSYQVTILPLLQCSCLTTHLIGIEYCLDAQSRRDILVGQLPGSSCPRQGC